MLSTCESDEKCKFAVLSVVLTLHSEIKNYRREVK